MDGWHGMGVIHASMPCAPPENIKAMSAAPLAISPAPSRARANKYLRAPTGRRPAGPSLHSPGVSHLVHRVGSTPRPASEITEQTLHRPPPTPPITEKIFFSPLLAPRSFLSPPPCLRPCPASVSPRSPRNPLAGAADSPPELRIGARPTKVKLLDPPSATPNSPQRSVLFILRRVCCSAALIFARDSWSR